MNISAENNAVLETFVQSPLIYSSDPENIQATSLLGQFLSSLVIQQLSSKVKNYQKFLP